MNRKKRQPTMRLAKVDDKSTFWPYLDFCLLAWSGVLHRFIVVFRAFHAMISALVLSCPSTLPLDLSSCRLPSAYPIGPRSSTAWRTPQFYVMVVVSSYNLSIWLFSVLLRCYLYSVFVFGLFNIFILLWRRKKKEEGR